MGGLTPFSKMSKVPLPSFAAACVAHALKAFPRASKASTIEFLYVGGAFPKQKGDVNPTILIF